MLYQHNLKSFASFCIWDTCCESTQFYMMHSVIKKDLYWKKHKNLFNLHKYTQYICSMSFVLVKATSVGFCTSVKDLLRWVMGINVYFKLGKVQIFYFHTRDGKFCKRQQKFIMQFLCIVLTLIISFASSLPSISILLKVWQLKL